MSSRLDELFAGRPLRLGVQEVAEILHMTNKGVYRWIQEGTIPAYKIGSSWVILRDELKDTLAQGSNLRSLREGGSLPPVTEDEGE